LLEDQFAAIGVVDHGDAGEPAINQAVQARLALAQGQRSVVGVEFQQIGGEQHRLGDGTPPVQRIKDGDGVRPTHCGLVVDRERQLDGGCDPT
jgi:hypothetical protein